MWQMEHLVDSDLREYVEREILPRYDTFDLAHRRDHAMTVISQSLKLSQHYDVDVNMVYAIAAYHDTGLVAGRDTHHLASGVILREDRELCRWFTAEQIDVMAAAVEDHRASSKRAPRTIYGCIVAEADRVIDSETILRRTIQFTLANHPDLDREEGYERMVEHLMQKYYYGGYLRLWIAESENAARLESLRQLIADRVQLRRCYDRIYASLTEV